MKIRLYDKFDHSFTVAIREDVKAVFGNVIYYTDDDEEEFDEEFVDWEEVE